MKCDIARQLSILFSQKNIIYTTEARAKYNKKTKDVMEMTL